MTFKRILLFHGLFCFGRRPPPLFVFVVVVVVLLLLFFFLCLCLCLSSLVVVVSVSVSVSVVVVVVVVVVFVVVVVVVVLLLLLLFWLFVFVHITFISVILLNETSPHKDERIPYKQGIKMELKERTSGDGTLSSMKHLLLYVIFRSIKGLTNRLY